LSGEIATYLTSFINFGSIFIKSIPMRKLLFLMAALPFISNSVKAQNETIRISSDTILVINNGPDIVDISDLGNQNSNVISVDLSNVKRRKPFELEQAVVYQSLNSTGDKRTFQVQNLDSTAFINVTVLVSGAPVSVIEIQPGHTSPIISGSGIKKVIVSVPFSSIVTSKEEALVVFELIQ